MIKLTNILQESDLGLTLKKGKTITVTHKTSGKEIVIIDKPSVRKEYEKIGFIVKEAKTINVEPNWEGMWRFFKQMAKTNPNDWKRIERTLGSDWKKIDAMAKKNKWTESVNEVLTRGGAIELQGQAKYLAQGIKDMTKSYKKKDWAQMEEEVDYIVTKAKLMGDIVKQKRYQESISEAKNTKSEWNNFEKLFGDFFTSVLRLGKANTKLTGDKTDEKIFIKNYNRDVGKFYDTMKSWRRGQTMESVNEGKWPDTQTADLLSQAFEDAKVKVQKVWEKGNHEYIIRVRAKDGWTNVRMELNVVSNVMMMDTQSGHVKLGELQPGSRGRKLSKNLKMLSKIPSFGVAGFKGLTYKIESVNESGIMYRAGVKKYGLEGMKKIQSAAGKGLGHAEIGKIKDKYDKKRKKKESVREGDTVEPKGNMAKIFKIVKDKQHAKIGGMLVDMFSASALVKIFDAVNDSNKEKLNKMNMNKLSYVLGKAFKDKVVV